MIPKDISTFVKNSKYLKPNTPKYLTRQYMATYLAGGMDINPAEGAHWRDRIKPRLRNQLFLTVYDPYEFSELSTQAYEHGNKPLPEWAKTHYPSYKEWCTLQYLIDVQTIENKIDFMIFYIDNFAGPGTYGQLTLADRLNLPIYVVIDPSANWEDQKVWLTGLQNVKKIFKSFDQLISYLKTVS